MYEQRKTCHSSYVMAILLMLGKRILIHREGKHREGNLSCKRFMTDEEYDCTKFER